MNADFEMTTASPLWEPADRWGGLLAQAFGACAHDAATRWPGRPISVLLCDDAEIRGLNRQWRGKDSATNVLSFPASGPAHPHAPLGDIAIAFETVTREAAAEGKTVDAHFAHLAVHGLLHLLGMDHEEDREAAAMEARERRILATLDIADPYAQPEPALL